MKKIFIINALLAAVIAVVACSKEDNKVQETPEIAVSQTGPVTISVNIPEDGLTKVALAQDPSDADGVVKLTWSDSDVITVKNAADESKSVVFDYVSGAGSTSAVFSAADVSALAGATSYNIYLTSGMPANYSNQNGSMGYSATLIGVNKYNDVTFSQTWAELAENGSGSCASSSVLRIRAKMPSAEIASAVQAVIIKSDKTIFAGNDSIRIECAPVVDGDVISVYATLPAGPVSEATVTKLIFQFQKSADKNDRLTAYREVGSLSFNDGSVNSIKISCTNIDKYAGTSDNGSLSNPYLVGDRNQLQYMNTLMSESEKHFKLIDDIKLRGFSWTPLNSEGTKVINLDGNNKKILNLNAALFFTFNGKVDNLTISKANIDVGNSNYGILGRQISVAGTHSITNVIIEDSKIKSTGNTIGGFFGTISQDCAINGCSATDLIIEAGDGSEGGATVGGFVANISAGALADISTAGSITARQNIGGIAGQSTINMTGVSSSMDITGANYYLGGLIGTLNSGIIDNCHATGSIEQTGGSSYSHTGGLIGIMNGGTVKNGCYHSMGTISVEGQNAGGLIGNMAGGTVDGCYASGSITTTQQAAGGLIGKAAAGEIKKSYYSTGTISAEAPMAGGLIGILTAATVKDCHASATITMTASSATYAHTGGLVGQINGNGTIARCYSDCVITVNKQIAGVFIGKIHGASISVSISNSYAKGSLTASGCNYIGGFIGTTDSDQTITVTNCYTKATISGKNNYSTCVFAGDDPATSTCTGFIGWINKPNWEYQYGTGCPSGNYMGTGDGVDDTIKAHANAYSWDSSIWKLGAGDPDDPVLNPNYVEP